MVAKGAGACLLSATDSDTDPTCGSRVLIVHVLCRGCCAACSR